MPLKRSLVFGVHSFSLTVLLAVSDPAAAQSDRLELTGDLAIDCAIVGSRLPIELPSLFPSGELERSEKSLWIAGGLSAILPGAGQIYAEAPLWRVALYSGIEAVGWTLFAVFSANGGRATRDFESFADANWDVTRYVEWITANYERWPDSLVNKQAVAEALAAVHLAGGSAERPWERIDFRQLNKLERAVKGGFSHTLPDHGEQQFYEMIGKYVQYRSGWSDHTREGDTLIYDPTRVTPGNLRYMEMRADANRLLGYASTSLGVILINHVASMLDAVLQARHVNATIRADLRGNLFDQRASPPTAMVHLDIRF